MAKRKLPGSQNEDEARGTIRPEGRDDDFVTSLSLVQREPRGEKEAPADHISTIISDPEEYYRMKNDDPEGEGSGPSIDEQRYAPVRRPLG